MPICRAARRAREPVGPPISHDTYMEDADLSEIQKDIAQNFAEAAGKLQEDLLNKKGLRQRWFSQKDFREMAIKWTDTLDKMQSIPGIDSEKVDRYGSKFLPLIKDFHKQYQEMMGTPISATAGAAAVGSSSHDVVDLVSSDGDEEMEDDDDDDDDIADDEDAGEQSAYFGSGLIPAQPSARARMFHSELERLERDAASAPQSSRTRAKGSAYSKKGGGRGGGKRSYSRRASGGFSKGSKSAAGVKKRSGTGERRSTGSNNGSARTAASGPFGSRGAAAAGGSSSRGGGRSGGGGGGGGAASSGIGLMRY